MGRVVLSVVSPVYKAEGLVEELLERLVAVLDPLSVNYEIILVEDGSPDGSWKAIEKVCAERPYVIGLKLSRNFGQHYAISAGLAKVSGDWVVVMDCDLQDRPEEIPRLLAKAQEGSDVVLARRAVRQDGALKRFTSRAFYGLLGYLTGTPQDPSVANFGIYHRKVVDAINAMPESVRYFPTMVRWVGFRSTALDVDHAARPDGKSSYDLGKLLRLALDICLAYSDKPLRLVVYLGFFVSLIGFGAAAYMIVRAMRGEIVVMGYASLIVSLWILAGLIIFIVGVVGLYVGRSFEGVKHRPAFIVDRVIQGDPRNADDRE
ncbi:MAG: glycosyltransferase family 2 protein [Flavobacteriales bacterium]|nr:glycosyltransferase family 2 protein [Flavobacteriales bacterium]